MQRTTDARVAHWFGVISDILQDPLTEVPHVELGDELRATFDVALIAWTWREPDGVAGFEINPADVSIPPRDRRKYTRPAMLNRHPLLRWFNTTRDPCPQTMGRVPTALVIRQDLELVIEVLRPLDSDQQLSIPYVLDGVKHRAFVLARTGRDFSDDDLEVARRLQPAFVALDRQAQLLARFTRPSTAEAAAAVNLTGRELAVLRLLAEGHTAYGIGRRLSISPRTAQKHLENVYRKLGVHDRLAAVRVATELELIASAHTSTASGHDSQPTAAVTVRQMSLSTST